MLSQDHVMLDLRVLAIKFLDQQAGFIPVKKFSALSCSAIDLRFPLNDVRFFHHALL
jgi:hypothetical protein